VTVATGSRGLLRHLPNLLTTARLVAVPVVALLLIADDGTDRSVAAVIFTLAAATDFLDGWLSRRFSVTSRYGRILDPIADRLLIDVAVLLLWWEDRVPLLLVLLVVGRDLALLVGLLFATGRGYRLEVNPIGKAGTFVTMVGLVLAMITPAGADVTQVILWSGVVLLLVAGAVYLRRLPGTIRRNREGAR
jgi:CDP-diacylglycerol--glycerol-3-phosphate 3-phosphatidyltransferase